VALTAIVAAPVGADDAQQRRRTQDNAERSPQAERAPEQAAGRERAVTRTVEPRREQRDAPVSEQPALRQQPQQQRTGATTTAYSNGRYYNGRYYAPRVVRPTIVRVVPYHPYVYRPSYHIGVYYGTGGYYPYGVTPRGYYEPIPGRYYGGVRITGVPRDAEVFADGYYVGLVNDFDGIFQHVNLEAGAHHIEINWGGAEPIAFDVYVRPGETTTFRGDGYFRGY
jgi:hypothetical protein